MKTHLIILTLLVLGILSCKESNKHRSETSATDYQKAGEAKEGLAEKTLFNQIEDKYIHTKYAYNDAKGRQVLIQNSYPKGGLKYIDSSGKDFTYAIFWTQISNKTDYPLALNIEFSGDSLELPNSLSTYFKVLLPAEIMTPEKIPLFNYGLENLKFSLDNGFGKSSSLQKTINSKDSCIFYVVVLTNQGIDGVVRAGFRLEEQNVLFSFNEKEIWCGHINLGLIIDTIKRIL